MTITECSGLNPKNHSGDDITRITLSEFKPKIFYLYILFHSVHSRPCHEPLNEFGTHSTQNATRMMLMLYLVVLYAYLQNPRVRLR